MAQVTFPANDVYTILVEECGAAESERAMFLISQSTVVYPARDTYEYRFRGTLGKGGKLRRENKDQYWLVTCYAEDANTERADTIRRANDRLEKLWWDTWQKQLESDLFT